MYIKRDILGVRGPVLIAETIYVFPIVLGGKGMVAI